MRLALLSIALVIASPAFASSKSTAGIAPAGGQDATSNAAQPAPAKATKARKICKRIASTGSRLGGGEKVCRTEEEWKRLGDG